jgi:hypothetical protein
MANRDLLKEAIADAKAVKETAIANAKAALEEAFTPYLKEKLAAKLSEMDEMDEEVDLKEADKMEEEVEESYNMDEADDKEGYEGQMGKKKMGTKEMSEAEEMEEEMDLDELLRELDEMDENINLTDFPDEEGEHGNVAGKNVNEDARTDAEEEGYLDGMKDEKEDKDDEEEIDLENMNEDDLKKFIEDVIADMVKAGELEAGEGMEGEEMGDEEEMESEEEVEITERKKYGGNKGDVPAAKRGDKKDTAEEEGVEDYKKKVKEMKHELDEAMIPISSGDSDFDIGYKAFFAYEDKVGGLSLDDVRKAGMILANKVKNDNKIKNTNEFFKGFMDSWNESGYDETADKEDMYESKTLSLKKELEEAYAALKTIKEELNEVNLFNAKLLYTNKIFKSKNLTESQKVKVLAAFDKAASVKEAKLVYETLSEGMKETKKSVNESLLRGSASKPAGIIEKKPIMEADTQVLRMQKLAGIIK